MADGEEKSRIAKLVVSVQRRLVKNLVQVLVFLGVLALYLLLGVALWWLLDWYIDPNNAPAPSTAKKDLFQALGLMMAGVAGAIGVYFTWRNLSQTRQSTERTLWLTEQGQITERFTRAIEQLGETNNNGEPKLELRLGGIYALERIAKDSPERDYSTVMEVLTAYVRQNSSIPSMETNEATDHKDPRADIKAVLDVVGRRQEDRVPEEYRVRPDFRGINLSKTILRGANLREAYLSGAKLSGADLRIANLRGADLNGADLSEADLRGANLREAYLSGAKLSGANLRIANLRGAYDYVGVADLSEADLREADLREVYLTSVNLSEADLSKADLREANLREANLTSANLSGAKLSGADLTGAVLQGAQEITNKVLESQARSLEGATMPDGSKHD